MIMKIINDKRCIIGEGPIWNDKERLLYFTNACGGNEICMLDVYTGKLNVCPVDVGVVAFAFDKDNCMIVSRKDGVFILSGNTAQSLYDTSKYNILYANDMKVGPDGRIYVGTQSSKRKGVSDKTDGKLYSIDKAGNVKVLLDNLLLSNGLDWSMDEKRFYHTDSPTKTIKEYYFDKSTGDITFTGREIRVPGVDGFTIDCNDNILAACWGTGHIAVVDTETMKIKEYIKVPCNIPASCAFAGEDMEYLVIVTASYGSDLNIDLNAGFTYSHKWIAGGRKPYIFG